MTLLDVNILLYAYNADAPQHRAAAAWLDALFKGPDLIGLPWSTLWAFLRISTDRRAWSTPKSSREVFEILHGWLSQPNVVMVRPGPRHLEIVESLVKEQQASGPLVSDAVLAALSLENGAALAPTDRDFGRFSGLRWINPLG